MSNKKIDSSLVFLPRSVLQPKRKGKDDQLEKNVQKLTPTVSSGSDEVKELCAEQRWPSNDEPVCCVCGKYGEYICDATDEDVCSLQCKKIHLDTHKQSSDPFEKVDVEVETALTETFECYYNRCTTYTPPELFRLITNERVELFRNKMEIQVKGRDAAKPVTDFQHLDFADQLMNNLTEGNYMAPTPVQMQVIPIILSGRDVLVSAATSSGKSASFLLPVIHLIFKCVGTLSSSHRVCKYPLALALSPTRELCMQLEEHSKMFGKQISNMKTALLVGGCPLPRQLYRLKHKIQLVIGTPGRINDILQNHKGALIVSQIKMVVLDEVDVMLQMGFHSQIQSILEMLPNKVQYSFFSATIPPSIEKMAAKIMNDPLHVCIGRSGVPTAHVKQIVLWVEETSKRKKLFSILLDEKHFIPPAVVFVESKVGADMLRAAVCKKFSLSCEVIHSDKTQNERTATLQSFLGGAYDILISTNIIGRGIDLVNVKQVILFDMPKTVEEYVHQVGRAGRFDAKGFSIAFINNTSKRLFSELKNLFDVTANKLPDEVLYSPYLMKKSSVGKQKNGKERKRKHFDEKDVSAQNLFEILTKKR